LRRGSRSAARESGSRSSAVREPRAGGAARLPSKRRRRGVREEGFEPSRSFLHGILSPARLPVPPLSREMILAFPPSRCICIKTGRRKGETIRIALPGPQPVGGRKGRDAQRKSDSLLLTASVGRSRHRASHGRRGSGANVRGRARFRNSGQAVTSDGSYGPTQSARAARVRRITGGCGGGNYCPDNPNTRAQRAAFLVKTFGM
jgi:hypothetical protein